MLGITSTPTPKIKLGTPILRLHSMIRANDARTWNTPHPPSFISHHVLHRIIETPPVTRLGPLLCPHTYIKN